MPVRPSTRYVADVSIKDCTQRPFGSLSKRGLPARLGWLVTPLSSGAIASFGLLITHRGLGFVATFALAPLLGASGYGVYSFAVSCAGLMMVPALLGTEGLLVRELAAYRHKTEWALARGLLLHAPLFVLCATLVLAAGAAVIGWMLPDLLDPEMRPAFWFSIAIMPILAFTYLAQAVMKGLGHVVLGQVPIFAIKPLLFAGAIGGIWLFMPAHASATGILALYAITYGCALIFAAWQLFQRLPAQVLGATAAFATRAWAVSAGPMLMIGLMQIVNVHADIVMLGSLAGAAETGTFGLANTAAGIVSLALSAMSAVIGPAIATAHVSGDHARLQTIVTKSARWILIASLPPALLFMFYGAPLLSLFGSEFAQGHVALSILAFGQIVNALMGAVGLILIMTGHERDAAFGLGVSTTLHVLLNFALIPHWGIVGAAIANASTLILWNLILTRQVYARLGVHATALGVVSFGRKP